MDPEEEELEGGIEINDDYLDNDYDDVEFDNHEAEREANDTSNPELGEELGFFDKEQ